MTKVAVSGYYGFNNFGDEAILAVILSKLKSMNADITVFSSNPDFTSRTCQVNTVKTFDFKNVQRTLKDTDVLVSGGGSLLQDVTSLKSLIYYAWVIYTALCYRKKVIIFAQGIGPINNKIAQFVVKNILKKCDYISVRDINSINLLKDWGIEAKLECDPVYSLDLETKQTENIVGVQLRDFKTMNDNLLNRTAEQIVKNFSGKKIEIYSLQDAIDLDVSKRFESILKTLNPSINTIIYSSEENDKLIERISRLEYLIAMRFHAALTAVKFGVKTAAINYDVKVEKLAQEAGLPLISMPANEDLDKTFEDLKNLNSQKLLQFAQTKSFNWNDFEKVFQA